MGSVLSGEKKKPKSDLLSTRDVVSGMGTILDRDGDGKVTVKDFEFIFEAKARALGMLEKSENGKTILDSDIYKNAAKKTTKILDADGDGKITPKDFEIMFQNSANFLLKHQDSVDSYLPFAGQCTFGLGVGFGIGRLARTVAKSKLLIVACGGAGYMAAQYYAQQDFLTQQALQTSFENRLLSLGDRNKDGKLDRKDLEELLDQKMKIINTKLGPGGFAPGVVGTTTFALGLLRGMRFI